MFYMNLAILDGICIYPTETGQRAFCPECGGAVMSKVGAIKEAHWAHLAETNCEGYYKPMSEWHRSWQEKFPKEWREIYTKKDGEVCIADVKTPRGTTIEFQHSNISEDNIAKRKRVHGDVFWVLDGEVYNASLKYFSRTKYESNSVTLDFTVNMKNNYGNAPHYLRYDTIQKYIDNVCNAQSLELMLSDIPDKKERLLIRHRKGDEYRGNDYLLYTDIKQFDIDKWNECGKIQFNCSIQFNTIGMDKNKEYRIKYGVMGEMNFMAGDFDAKADITNVSFKIDGAEKTQSGYVLDYWFHRFFNSNGVFIDNAKNVPEDSLLQVFKDGTFKIFKKEGFIEKLLSHSQTKTN